MKRNIYGWICVDAQKTGTWAQAEALAKRWLVDSARKPVSLPNWCRWMPPGLFAILPGFLKRLAVKNFSDALSNIHGDTHDLPDIVIAAGRQAVLVALALKPALKQIAPPNHQVKTVVLMNPMVSCQHFDTVIAPIHDQLAGQNVISTCGAMHGIEPAQLVFPRELQSYSNPRVGVLLGGNSLHGVYKKALAIKLAHDLKDFIAVHGASPGASLIITPSRRTPVDWLAIFEENLTGLPYWLWDQTSPNPYPNLLAGLDAIIVCEDSISMASEACVMGKPVLIYPTGIETPKFKRFYQQLFARGHAQAFAIDAKLSPTPILKEVDRVVKRLNVIFS